MRQGTATRIQIPIRINQKETMPKLISKIT